MSVLIQVQRSSIREEVRKLRIALCEDLRRDADQLRALLGEYCMEHQLDMKIDCFNGGEALLGQFQPGEYQILFLDILMDGTNGMETAHKIRQSDGEVTIIFVTVSEEYAVESYAVDASYYLVKPLNYENLSMALARCQHVLQQHAKFILVSEGRQTVRVRLRDIMYIESKRNDCILYTKDGEIRTRAKLSELEADLGGRPFLRCHRSFVVNLHSLSDILDNHFYLSNGSSVPISRAYRGSAQEAFRKYLITGARGHH